MQLYISLYGLVLGMSIRLTHVHFYWLRGLIVIGLYDYDAFNVYYMLYSLPSTQKQFTGVQEVLICVRE